MKLAHSILKGFSKIFASLVMLIMAGFSPALAVKWAGDGLRLETTALSQEVARGFFIGRGFSAAQAREVARGGCFFRSALGHYEEGHNEKEHNARTDIKPASKNLSTVHLDLTRWQVRPTHTVANSTNPQNTVHRPKTREDWQKDWKKYSSDKKISQEAQAGFYWALFPTRQSYQQGDYNWGFLSFNLPPGTLFDLTVRWQLTYKSQPPTKGQKTSSPKTTQHQTVLRGLKCGS